MEEIVNKVAASGIITLDLEELYPQGERVVFVDNRPVTTSDGPTLEDLLHDTMSLALTRHLERTNGTA